MVGTHPRAKLVPETKLKRPVSVRSQFIDCPNSVGYTVTRWGAPELNTVPREMAMNCYVCVQSGQEQTAVGICRFCSVALCADHMADVQNTTRVECTTPVTIGLPSQQAISQLNNMEQIPTPIWHTSLVAGTDRPWRSQAAHATEWPAALSQSNVPNHLGEEIGSDLLN